MINLEHNNPGRRFLPAVLGVFIACGLFATPARAQVTVVTNCTELAFTNALAAGGIVTFTQDCSGITLTAPIIISTDTTIDTGGHSVHINGNQLLVFTVTNAAHFTNVGLTITGGRGTNGGALCINSNATVLLTNCTFSGNNAVGPDGTNGAAGANTANNGGNGGNGVSGVQALGGAIYNLGTLTALRCQFVTNNATGGNGGSGGNGGNGVFSGGNGGSGGNGAAANGGAIYDSAGGVCLVDCTFSRNTVTGGNGGDGGPSDAGGGDGGNGGNGIGGGFFSSSASSTNLVINCTFNNDGASGGTNGLGGDAPFPGSDGDPGSNGGGNIANVGSSNAL